MVHRFDLGKEIVPDEFKLVAKIVALHNFKVIFGCRSSVRSRGQ